MEQNPFDPTDQEAMNRLFTFMEGDISVTGPKEELLELAAWIDGSSQSTELFNKWTDISFSIRVQLDEAFNQ